MLSDDIPRSLHETYMALRRHPLVTSHELGELLGLSGEHSMRNRLQRLRRLGLAVCRGRGVFARWEAIERSGAADEVAPSLVFEVHNLARSLGGYRSAEELAALLDAPLDQVLAAQVYLRRIGSATGIGNRIEVNAPAVTTEAGVRHVVREWVPELSPKLRSLLSTNDIEALVQRLVKLLA